jgi:phosphatidylinositol alpha-1,6-mannosyltransferase
MSRAASDTGTDTMLLLAPSTGFGGGIERVADVVERAWPGHCLRLDLYRLGRERDPAGNRARQARFGAQALGAALRIRPELVFCLHAGLLPVATAAASAGGARLAVWGHGDEVWLGPGPAKRALWHRVDAVLTSSTFTGERLLETTGVDASRVHPMHVPVAPAFEPAGNRRQAQERAEPRVISVGRVSRQSRYKGYYEVADCLPLVLAAVPAARWQVVGDGDDVPALLAHCAGLGLPDEAVTISSGLDDDALAAAYGGASVLALPSTVSIGPEGATGEGFGLVYAEAGMFGVPAIASRKGGGALDFVEDGSTGLTVQPGDREALAAAIVAMLTDRALRDRLGEAARKRARLHHTFAAFEAEFLDTLK